MSELGKEYENAVAVNHLDATTEENKPKQADYGFNNHGLIIQNQAGDIVFKQADHAVKAEDVRAYVEKHVKKP